VVAVLVYLMGCGQSSSVDTGGAPEGAWNTVALPPGFQSGDLVATDRTLIRVGGSDPGSEPDVETRRRSVLLVDLETGESSEVDAWSVEGAAVEPVDGASLDGDRLVVIGRTCTSTAVDGSCQPGDRSSAVLDLRSRSWTVLQLPPGADGPFDGMDRLLDAPLGEEPVAVLGIGEGRHVRSLVLVGDRWDEVGPAVEGTTSMCRSGGAVHALHVGSGGPAASDPAVPTEVWVESLRLDGGEPVRANAPAAVSGRFGGAGVHLACGSGDVYLASANPAIGEAPAEPLAIWRLDGEGWSPLAEGVPSGLAAASLLGGPRGVVVDAVRVDVEPIGRAREAYALTGDTAVAVGDLGELSSSVWLGETGDLIRITPDEDRYGTSFTGQRLEVIS